MPLVVYLLVYLVKYLLSTCDAPCGVPFGGSPGVVSAVGLVDSSGKVPTLLGQALQDFGVFAKTAGRDAHQGSPGVRRRPVVSPCASTPARLADRHAWTGPGLWQGARTPRWWSSFHQTMASRPANTCSPNPKCVCSHCLWL
jgi:hypothetical protein